METVFMIIYRKMNWFDMQILHPPLKKILVFVDLVSVIPFEFLYEVVSADPNVKMMACLRLRYALRITRFVTEIERLRNLVGSDPFIIIFMEYLLIVTITLFASNCIGYIAVCASVKCSHKDREGFYRSLYAMAGKVTTRSIQTAETVPLNLLYVYLITNLSMYIYLKGFVTAKFVTTFKQANLAKGLFTNKALVLYRRYNHLFQKDKLLENTLIAYYISFWKIRHGIMRVDIEHILPEIHRSQMKLDLCWKQFQHSHLFRGEDLDFLHHLSQFVRNTFKSAGEILYTRGDVKTSMIYVVAGIVQVFSDEDGETPILSFSGGTCFGEASLFVSSRSVCTVVCKTDCEIDVLEASGFVKIIRKYPEKYQKCRSKIYERLAEAKKYEEVKAFQREVMNVKESPQLLTMKWLIMTLKHLLSPDPHHFETHLKGLNIEDRLLAVKLKKMLFCPHYLDLLVLTKSVEFKGDSIFVKTKFPCIFQPDSVLIRIWEKTIALTVLMLLFIYPLYAAFFREMTLWYLIFISLVTLLWILDVFVKLSTAIRTNNGLVITISEIASRRIGERLFLLDVIAAIPFEVLTILMTGYNDEGGLICLQMTRALKIALLQNLFTNGRNSVNTHLLLLNCLKCLLHLVLLVYWIAALIYLMILQDGPNSVYYELFKNVQASSPGGNLMVCIFLATLLVTGLNVYIPALADQSLMFYLPLILITVFTILLYLTFLGNVTASESIRVHGSLMLQEYYKDVTFLLKKFNFDQDFHQRILRYTNHQWLATNGIDFLQKNSILRDIPHELYLIIRRFCLLEYVQKVALFQEIPKPLLAEYCSYFVFWDIPAGEVITYAGEVASEMYIINNGYCETVSADGQIRRVVGPGESFAVVESCLKVPIVNSVVAVTDCALISLKYKHFVQASATCPEMFEQFQKVIDKSLESWTQTVEGETTKIEGIARGRRRRESSVVFFSYRMEHDSDEGRDYYEPFERLGYWSFLRYLLLRCTFRCYGKIACYWELIRCIFCFFSAVFNAIPYVSTCFNCRWWWALRFFDLNALLDIYVRHHITYFDENGIEVTHPVKTASHYWKTSFIIDLLALIPLLNILQWTIGRPIEPMYLNALLRYNKTLQMYRIVQGMRYLRKGVDAKLRIWTPLMYVPPFLVAIIHLAVLAFNLTCHLHWTVGEATDLFGAHVTCMRDSWIGENSNFEKPISLFRVALYCAYYITTMVTAIGLHGYYYETFHQVVIVALLSFCGFLAFEFMSAKMIAINMSRNVGLTVYQEATRALVRFLNLKKIDEKLKLELIEHFEYVYSKLRGVRYEATFGVYNNALKEEALYKIFGNAMKQSKIFKGASPSFFRSLLIHMKHRIILRRGIISRVNDISGLIYFVFKGEVEVLGPDYNRLLVLPRGSLFGNLDEIRYSRRTLTMVAKGHVELLEIDTINFYTVLNRYEKLESKFKSLTMVNVDYLVGGKIPKMTHITETEDQKDESRKKTKQQSLRIKQKTPLGIFFSHLFAIRNVSRASKVWDSFILIVVCFAGYIIEMYRVTMKDRAVAPIAILYFFDFLYIIRIYVKFHTAYVDELGALMTNRAAVFKHYLKKGSGFRIDFVTVIPFELVAFLFYEDRALFWKVFIYSRCNRLLRLFFVIDYFRKTNKKININVYRVKAMQMIVFIVLTIQLATTLVIVLGCTDEKSNAYPLMVCDFDSMTSLERFNCFVVQLSNVVSIFTATSFRRFYPNSAIMILLMLLYMFVCRILMILFTAEICASWEVILHNRLAYEQRITQFKMWMTMQGLSPVLVERTWNYFRLLWGKQSGLQFPTLLEEAPYYLREAVLNSMFGYHLRNHPVLKGCHVDLIRQMAAQMRTRIFFPGDYVAFKNDIDECMYFIHEGEIFGLSRETLLNEVIDKVFRAGDMFGLNQGMYGRTGHDYTYRVNQFSIVVVLRRKTWIHLLDFYPASKVLIYDDSFVK